MKLKPAGHRVLIKLKTVEEEYKTSSIVLPEELKARHQAGIVSGEVVELGFTAFRAYDDGEPWCKVGDKVLFVQYSGLNYEDKETNTMYQVINDEDVIAVIED